MIFWTSPIGNDSGLILQEAPFELRKSIEDTVKTLELRAKEKQIDLSCVVDTNIPDSLDGRRWSLASGVH